MKKFLLALLILSFSMISVASSCTNTQDENTNQEVTQISQKQGKAKMNENFSDSVTYFGKNILTDVYKNKNTVVSPLSLHLAFDMLYNGAEGITEKEMQTTLGYPANMDKKAISEQSKAIMDFLKSNEDITIEIANSLWAKKNFSIKPTFIENSKEYFYAEVKNEISKTLMNNWVSEKTHKKIKKIVDRADSIDVALLNAIYFNGTWIKTFNKENTKDQDFTTIANKKIKVPMMYKFENMPYYENENYQMVKLDYKGRKASMYVFLPKENSSIDNFINNFSQEEFLNASDNLDRAKVELYLPKFKTECSFGLTKTIEKIGMKSAFDSRANFSGIARGLFISQVIHKTYIDVNESGTEAAAVTGIIMTKSAMPRPVPTKHMKIDRPFFFVIADSRTYTPIFMGAITKPEYK